MNRKWHIDADGKVDAEATAFIQELKTLILSRHPEATFAVSSGADNPTAIHLHAYVDLDDPFEVTDEIMDRIVDIQLDEDIPLHVIPHRTAARVVAHRQQNVAG
jgi:hypothetical protein